jgi:hypothetical protein
VMPRFGQARPEIRGLCSLCHPTLVVCQHDHKR